MTLGTAYLAIVHVLSPEEQSGADDPFYMLIKCPKKGPRNGGIKDLCHCY